MRSLFSLLTVFTVSLYAFLMGTVGASGPIDLRLGDLTVNDQGLKLEAVRSISQDDFQTVVPSLKDVLEMHDRSVEKPSTSKQNKVLPKMSYEDKIMEEISGERPSSDEVNERRHNSGYYHVNDEDEFADTLCDDDEVCDKDVLNWAAAPLDPKALTDRKLKRAKRDKKYEWAIKKGTEKANDELKKIGGADPYGGLLMPHLMDKEQKDQKEDSKLVKEETKGTKTLKGSKKGDKAKRKKRSPTEEEPDVATAPDA